MPGQHSCISTSNTFSPLVLSQWLLAFLPAHSPAPLTGLNLSVWGVVLGPSSQLPDLWGLGVPKGPWPSEHKCPCPVIPFLPYPEGAAGQARLQSSSPAVPSLATSSVPAASGSLWNGTKGGKLDLNLLIWKMGLIMKPVLQNCCGHEMST